MLNNYKYFYFLGIGGIGMSALARYFHANGFAVAGYDRTPTELTDKLEAEGMRIHFEDDVQEIPAEFLANKEEMLVVYTPAIPKDQLEYNFLIDNGYALKKRAVVLAMIANEKRTIAVAGTHGKTSTASIISHILKTAGVPFYAFLGGIASNYQTNFLSPEKGQDADLVVVEADEFDRSFHQLNPDIAIITAIESDHLDIYGTEENLIQAFFVFGRKVKAGGELIVHKDVLETAVNHQGINIDDFIKELDAKNVRLRTYNFNSGKPYDYSAENVRIVDGEYHFNFIHHDEFHNLSLSLSFDFNDLVIGVPGRHNIENSIAAIAATYWEVAEADYNKKTDLETVFHKALSTFKGVHRRFEVAFKNDDIAYIDDYAHHPTEIKVTLETLRELYPGKKLLAVFQPHLFTRTRDLAPEFAQSLSLADELILLPIYPARELPMPGVTSRLILDEVTCPQKQIMERDAVPAYLKNTDAEVIVTLGAGDIDRLVSPIKQLLADRYKY